jgi:hypothetical protein
MITGTSRPGASGLARAKPAAELEAGAVWIGHFVEWGAGGANRVRVSSWLIEPAAVTSVLSVSGAVP